MPVYVVSYDLTRPGQNYDSLWDELSRLGGRRVLYSQFAVRYTGSAAALRDHLWPFMDHTDRLLVMARDGAEWASQNAMIDLNHVYTGQGVGQSRQRGTF